MAHIASPICIAPEHVLIRYLAILRRALTAIAAYGKSEYRPGIVFAGLLADALHNLPNLLLYYDTPFIEGPHPMEDWLWTHFPAELEARKFPEHVHAACQRILLNAGFHVELGLRIDHRNLHRAPNEKMQYYLNLLYEACLGMRIAFGNIEDPMRADEASGHAWQTGALMAHVLRDVPIGLVRWNQFDEVGFWAAAEAAADSFPPEVKDSWRTYVKAIRPRVLNPTGISIGDAALPPAWQVAKAPLRSASNVAIDMGRIVAGGPSLANGSTGHSKGWKYSERAGDYQWITERIAVGSAVDKPEYVLPLIRDAITHVLDCRMLLQSADLYRGTNIVYRQNGTADDGKAKPDKWFWDGIDFVLSALRLPRARVLVHCQMGMSRSPSMVYAVLRVLGMKKEDAEQNIRNARSRARVRYQQDADRAAESWLRR